MIYADTSLFVSLYVVDRHWDAADKLVRAEPHVWFTPLHFAEFTHAVSQHVFRGLMEGPQADQVRRALAADRSAGLWTDVTLPEHAFELCADLARRHGTKLGIRTLDSLHVACALELKADRFWTFDERQAKLARAEGLKISG